MPIYPRMISLILIGFLVTSCTSRQDQDAAQEAKEALAAKQNSISENKEDQTSDPMETSEDENLDDESEKQTDEVKTVTPSASKTKKTKLSEQDILNNPSLLAKGKMQYKIRCLVCHGPKGQGSVGPNLTDDYWLHSKGEYSSIIKNIQEGFPSKGMIAWKNMISFSDQQYIAAYVRSIMGSKPKNPKAPQGKKVTP
jgi:mono/diheme cytochrome c family protein